jgi:hypothetical protein
MTTSNLIVPRRVFDEIGMFANLCHAHDMDLSCGWSWKGVPSVTCQLLRYRIHAVKGVLKVKVEWTDVAVFHPLRVRFAEAGFYARFGRIRAVACLQNFRLPPIGRRAKIYSCTK